MSGEPRERAVELLVVGAVELHSAALTVNNRDDAVHIGVIFQEAERRTRSAMYLLVLAEQFTVPITAR